MKKKILIASANPYAFCIAVEQHIARTNAADCQVDALNLYKLAARHSPYYNGWAHRLVVSVNRMFERFVLPHLSGRDITAEVKVDHAAIPPLPTTIKELRDHEIEGAKIGYGVMSSMITLTTISGAEAVDEYGPGAQAAWRAAHLSYQTGKAVESMGYDEIYVFNGRHCFARPFCDILERSTRVVKYETGGCEDTTTYVTSDRSVHEPSAFASIIDEHETDYEAGAAFYEARFGRARGNGATMLRGLQRDGHLPEGVIEGDYVAFFTSSTDERVAALGVDNLGAFGTQHAAALAVARICRSMGKTAVVRLHPHLRFKHPSWKREWDFEELRAAGALVLQPTDPCDSYALARAAHCVVTAGSTVSFESAYLGLPNAAVGDSLPVQMGVAASAMNEAELAAFIANPTLPEGAREAALAFGSYSSKGGMPLPGYELGKNVRQAKLHGRIIDPVRYASHPIRSLLRG